MDEARDRPTSVVSDQLHPLVYGAMAGLVLCLGLGIVGIAVPGTAGLVFSALAGGGFVTITVLLLVRRCWSSFEIHPRLRAPTSFSDWVSGDFDAWDTRLKGSNAAILALLQIAAIALGMDAFALAWHLAVQI